MRVIIASFLILCIFTPGFAQRKRPDEATMRRLLEIYELVVADKLDEADGKATQLLSEKPDDSEVTGVFAQIKYLRGDTLNARKWTDRTLELDPKSAQVLILKGADLLLSGDIKGAIKSFETSLVSNIDQPQSHYFLGELYAINGEFKKAQSAFRRAEALGYKSAKLYRRWGHCALNTGDLQESTRVFARALALEPTWLVLWLNLGLSYQYLGDLDRAASVLDSASVRFPESSELFTTRAKIEILRENWTAAKVLTEKAERSKQCSNISLLEVAIVDFMLGDSTAADSLLRLGFEAWRRSDKEFECLTIANESPGKETFIAGILSSAAARGDSVLFPLEYISKKKSIGLETIGCHLWADNFSKSDSIRWPRDEYLAAWAVASTLFGNNQFAEACWESACSTSAIDYSYWLNLGCLKHRLGRREQAEAAYIRCLEIAPDCLTALCNLMSIHYSRNDSAGYRRYYEQLKKVNPKFAVLAAKLLHNKLPDQLN